MSGQMERLILALVLLQMHQSRPHLDHLDRPQGARKATRLSGLTGRVIQLELDLESSIGQPASLLEELDNLVNHLIEVHHHPSTCASAASVSGSQNVIS